MNISRRSAIMGAVAAMTAGPGLAAATQSTRFSTDATLGLPYLESTGDGFASAKGRPYIAPSDIPAVYSHAIYVNCATRGEAAQKMWVLERRDTTWALALWDEALWAKKGDQPSYSWPVSTGRPYPGQKRAGPTPLGIFNVDDRRSRHVRGWGSPGMYNSIYIDLHYSSGRISGVAIHGTTASKYRLLGRADSHGCVRVTQDNSKQLWSFFHPANSPGKTSPLWRDDVPRYFESEPTQSRAPRWKYRRDGTLITDADGDVLTKAGYSVLLIFYRDDPV